MTLSPIKILVRPALCAGFALLSLTACSEDDPGSGMDGTGGAGTGGATGGAGTGGAATGGAGTGGAATGGAASGGAASGGASTGGAASGGAASGGAGTGGAGTGGDGTGTGGEGSGGDSGGGEFTLTSTSFTDMGMIPDAHTCAAPEGFMAAPAPQLTWSNPPEGTMSFAMVMLDKTLVDGGNPLGYHSAVWNIPASVMELPEDFENVGDALTGTQSISDGYLGPCPNYGTGMRTETHEYTFTVYALPEATIQLSMSLDAQFIQTLETAALGSVVLTGTSDATGM